MRMREDKIIYDERLIRTMRYITYSVVDCGNSTRIMSWRKIRALDFVSKVFFRIKTFQRLSTIEAETDREMSFRLRSTIPTVH